MSHTQEQNLVETTDSKPQEDWMARRWRPLMGYIYMAICACDFIVFPVLWSMTQAVYHIVPFVQWQPLTLQGAGMIHIAFGAILGIAAYGRTKEKMAGAEQGGLNLGQGTTYQVPGQPAGMMNNGGMNNGSFNSNGFNGGSTFGSPTSGGFNSAPPAFGSTTPPAFGSTPAPTFNTAGATCPNTGKPLGPAQSFPAI